MKRLIGLFLAAVLLDACAAPAPTPTPRPAPMATSAPTPTRAASVDYAALRASLLTPLGGLIVATRDRSATRAAQLAAFDAAADAVLPTIKDDTSVNANRLHSVVVNTRDAASRGDLAALEQQRLELLKVQ